MRPVSEASATVTKTIFSRKYIALGRILSQWNDIVGAELALKAQPVALHYRKHKDQKKTPDATLEIATTSAYATRLHYQKDLILERIHHLFGERWVTAIRFVNTPSNVNKMAAAPRKPASLSAEEEKYIAESLDLITDPDIRNRLENFGKSLLLDQKNAKE
ncbi:MAG: DUF721 domain-containing protein [Alphaproteobacteria bacterium]